MVLTLLKPLFLLWKKSQQSIKSEKLHNFSLYIKIYVVYNKLVPKLET